MIRSEQLAIVYRPDGKRVASGGRDGVIRIWEPDTGKLVQMLFGPANGVFSLAWSPDGQWITSAGLDCRVCLWHAEHGQFIRTWREKDAPENAGWVSVLWTPDGEQVTLSTLGRGMWIWNNEGVLFRRLPELGSWPTLSPDGKLIGCIGKYGVADSNRYVSIVDATTGKEVRKLIGDGKPFAGPPSWSQDSRRVAAVGASDVFVWNVADSQELLHQKVNESIGSHTVTMSPDGKMLGVVHRNGFVTLIPVIPDSKARTVESPGTVSISWSPDSTGFAFLHAHGPNGIGIHHAATDKIRWLVEPLPAFYWDVTWSPDSKGLWTATSDTRLISADTGETLTIVKEGTARGFSKVSPDGQTVAADEAGDGIVVRDTAGKSKCTLKPELGASGFWWSPDSQRLAILHHVAKKVSLWNAATGQREREIGEKEIGALAKIQTGAFGLRIVSSWELAPVTTGTSGTWNRTNARLTNPGEETSWLSPRTAKAVLSGSTALSN